MSSYPLDPRRRFVRGTRGGKIRQATTVWYEHTPAAGAVAAILSATPLADGAPTVVTKSLTQPDVPRVLTVKGNAASLVGPVTIQGLDANHLAISETLTLDGTTVVVGTQAFSRIHRITLPPRAASTNTVSVGTGSALGLWHTLHADVRLVTTLDGAPDAGTLSMHAEDVARNLFTPAGVLTGTKILRIIYLV
ncbi:MAG: hypothetical protein EI684_15310 [Candidatus Viridilinea halotolerans]|uniref:Uncharacterized protein n=1 Tax=Candidatus Viridilinea halotolerans TaxID=2491704 RepID=A0A426TVQ1_9CHLR|nr:MAG: hypothetical protein EI684_15310 [Candidatus Viridilinea halotolerans]